MSSPDSVPELFQTQIVNIDKLWHGKKAAVVLTYDDALDVHLDHAIPALDSLGFKGSFYLSAAFPGSKNRIPDWRKAAANGHELGNHTYFTRVMLPNPAGRG